MCYGFPMPFPEYSSGYSFPDLEKSVLLYWKKYKVFERLLEKGEKNKAFTFYDGPPFATGLPHYGSLLAGTIKDIVPRYWTMRGFYCKRRFGWDTHGLPVEYEIEKKLKLNGSPDIRRYGVDKFNEACRELVLRYAGEWREFIERMGRWVELDNDYKTMDPDFMESIWWVFKTLWEQKLIYRGKKILPYSWRVTSPLSNFEAGLNYQSVQDPAITVLLPFLEKPEEAFLIWTTTPWTLPANLALALHPELNYVKVEIKNKDAKENSQKPSYAWLGASRLSEYEKELKQEVIEKKKGKDLIGISYESLFDFFSYKRKENAFQVIEGDFVTDTDGTGIVHMAPAFGENDYYSCKKAQIESVDPTDANGEFTELSPPYKGKFVKDADKDIIQDLKKNGRLLRQATIQHNYPYCYRSNTPLLYKEVSSWFLDVEKIKENLLKNNQEINWIPDHLQKGRFGKWLEQARDWCIARNRFWGTPIPVWTCRDCGEDRVIESKKELSEEAGEEIKDIHSHKIDHIRLDCKKCNKKKSMERTPEILDCWFESGAMPYAQEHYPFEGKENFKNNFPADFIAEGLDQTRGWFYTLTVLSTALFNKPAFKNVIVNGMLLAEDGKKMSKSLQNYPDPKKMLDQYGADAIRLYFMQSPAMHGVELRFSEKYMVDEMRNLMLPLWNAYNFFSAYANIDKFTKEDLKKAPPLSERSRIDRWILAHLRNTEVQVHQHMEKYHLTPVATHLGDFIDNLTNWYIRLNRQRFWTAKSESFSPDKLSAYATLWEVFHSFSKLLAPFLPFFSECLYTSVEHQIAPNKLPDQDCSSVHECVFDVPEKEQGLSKEDQKLLQEMAIAQRTILLGRSLRSEAKIPIRQPLQKITVAGLNEKEFQLLLEQKELVLQELNIKEITTLEKPEELVEESVKPNLPSLGPKAAKQMKSIMQELAKWGSKEIKDFEKKGKVELAGIELLKEDIFIARKAKSGKCAGALEGLVAELDTTLNPKLLEEGLKREIINRIQQRRKGMQLALISRIRVYWAASGQCAEILRRESKTPATISQEILANSWEEKEASHFSKEDTIEIKQQNESMELAFSLEVV